VFDNECAQAEKVSFRTGTPFRLSSILVSSMCAVICIILARGISRSGARVAVAAASIHREALIDLARALLLPLRQPTAHRALPFSGGLRGLHRPAQGIRHIHEIELSLMVVWTNLAACARDLRRILGGI